MQVYRVIRLFGLALVLLLATPARATVSTTMSAVEYMCDGTVKVFTVPFRFLDPSHLRVSHVLLADPYTETVLPITSAYAVGGAGSATGGTVSLVTPSTGCATGYKLRIRRLTPRMQGTALSTQAPYNPKALEAMADRHAMIAQEVNDGALLSTQNFNLLGPTADSGLVTATGGNTPRSLASRFADVVSPKDYGAACDGSTDDSAALAAAHAAAVTANAVLYIQCKVRVASGSIALSQPLRFEGAGAIDVSSGSGTVTITGPLTAPLTQVFYRGSGALTFSAQVAQIAPQWWGAKGNWRSGCTAGVTCADDTVAIQAALIAGKGREIDLAPGAYLLTESLDMTRNTLGWTLKGHGTGFAAPGPPDGKQSALVWGGPRGRPMIDGVGSFKIAIRDLWIYSPLETPAQTGLLFGRCSAASSDGHFVERTRVDGWYTVAAIYEVESERTRYVNVDASNSYPSATAYGYIRADWMLFGVTSRYNNHVAGGANALAVVAPGNNTWGVWYGGQIGNESGVSNAAVLLDGVTDFTMQGTYIYNRNEGGASIEIGAIGYGNTNYGVASGVSLIGMRTEGAHYGIKVSTASVVDGLTLIGGSIGGYPSSGQGTGLYAVDGSTIRNLTVKGHLVSNGNRALDVYALFDSTVDLSGQFCSVRHEARGNLLRGAGMSGNLQLPASSSMRSGNIIQQDHGIPGDRAELVLDRVAANVSYSTPVLATIANGATYTPAAAGASVFFLAAARNGATASVANPAGGSIGQTIDFTISAGTRVLAVAWGNAYRMSSWGQIAAGKTRSIRFVRNGGGTWTEVYRSADI